MKASSAAADEHLKKVGNCRDSLSNQKNTRCDFSEREKGTSLDSKTQLQESTCQQARG